MARRKNKSKFLDYTASWLVIIGAINWGLTVFNFNLVEWLGNITIPMVATIVYSIVGISGLWVAGRSLAGKFMK